MAHSFGSDWSAFLNCTLQGSRTNGDTFAARFLDPADSGFGRVPGLPGQKLNAGVRYRARNGASVAGFGQFVSEQRIIYNNNTIGGPLTVRRQDGYLRLNIEARYPLLADIEINLFIRNLLDANYQERFGFPAAGRNFGLAFRMRIFFFFFRAGPCGRPFAPRLDHGEADPDPLGRIDGLGTMNGQVAVVRPGSRPAARTRTDTTTFPDPEAGETESQPASFSTRQAQGRRPVVLTASGFSNARLSALEARKDDGVGQAEPRRLDILSGLAGVNVHLALVPSDPADEDAFLRTEKPAPGVDGVAGLNEPLIDAGKIGMMAEVPVDGIEDVPGCPGIQGDRILAGQDLVRAEGRARGPAGERGMGDPDRVDDVQDRCSTEAAILPAVSPGYRNGGGRSGRPPWRRLRRSASGWP